MLMSRLCADDFWLVGKLNAVDMAFGLKHSTHLTTQAKGRGRDDTKAALGALSRTPYS